MNKLISVICLLGLFACQQSEKRFSLNGLELGLNNKGQICRIVDRESKTDYINKEGQSSLLSIRVKNQYEQPASCTFNSNDSVITLKYPVNDVVATIKVNNKSDYLTFELNSITHPEIIELVLWGPYQTSIKQTVGETIGVVRNSQFSIGIQALNIRTLGGYPQNEDDSFTGYDIFATTSLVDVADSINIVYRGDAAKPQTYGSSLNAYTRSRDKDRMVACMNHEKYLAPAFKDEGIVGSKIALFGCHPDKVLDVIGKMELKEGLPHPTLNGEWAKRSQQATSAYLIQDFDMKNYQQAIELTKKAGLKYLYHGGPFKTWGHFDLLNNMSWNDLSKIVKDAELHGIKVGAHTLSNFITTNDAYVTPVPDSRLAKVGSSVLSANISANDKTIGIEDPSFFNQMKNNSLHAVVIGSELIRYEKVSDSAPWILQNCERGAFNTSVVTHQKGEAISKLADHAYKTFLTNNELASEMSETIAKLYNQTGLKQISFDGLEGNYSTGMGGYGELRYVKNWYDHLNPEIKNDYIMDASRPGHYFWHLFTRMNWGEPWYAGFRESQTAYRLLNQDYFRRNYIPCMLGWFNMGATTSIEDIEWMLARSAAFDAGYALVTNATIIEKNGYSNQILEKIAQWEKARMSKAFSIEQKKRMENIKAEFTLQTINENQWNLIPIEIQRYEHKYRELQPGQPTWTAFDFNNPNKQQSMGFILSVANTSASKITIDIDNFKKIEIDATIKPGEYLKYQGGNEIVLYSENWQKIKSLPIDPEKLTLAQGSHSFKVDCSFAGKEGASLKMELKTAGEPEQINPK